MKTNIENFPKIWKPQGKIEILRVDLENKSGIFELLFEISRWKETFEQELREEVTSARKSANDMSNPELVRGVWRERALILEEILGDEV